MSNTLSAPADSASSSKEQSGSTSWLSMVKQTWSDFSEDNAMRLAAAMACYIMLALAPLIVIAFKVLYVVFGDRTDVIVTEQTKQLIGPQAGQAIGQMVEKANEGGGGTLATTVSLLIVLFSASGVFVSLQDALNTIWEVKPKPDAGWGPWIRKRFLSIGMVFGIAILLLTSMLVTAMLNLIVDSIFGENRTGFFANAAAYVFDFVITVGVAWALFMAVFKFLPDVKIAWRDVWVGALVTAVLFKIGQIGMAIYFNHGATSAYGTFGSIVAVLLWAYYSSIIMFFGAEFTQVWATAHGRDIEPEEHAVRITENERAGQGLASKERIAEKAYQCDDAQTSLVSNAARPKTRPASGAAAYARVKTKSETKPYTLGIAGAAAGALAAGLATYYLATDKKRAVRQQAALSLNERVNAVESKIGRVNRIKEYLDQMSVKERIDQVEHEIQRAGRHVRAQETGRPLWMVRVADFIGGRWSNL